MTETNRVGSIRTKKALIRKEMLKKRHALAKDDRERLSGIICLAFLESDDYKNAGSILLYKAYNNEVDTDAIFRKAMEDGKTVAYPISRMADGEPDLDFYIITDHKQLTKGFMDIPEPDPSQDLEKFTGTADICVTPGVSFDRKCHRIGYGKAFYDRYIRLNTPKTVIGLAYCLQIADDFDPEDSDKAVDKVITEQEILIR